MKLILIMIFVVGFANLTYAAAGGVNGGGGTSVKVMNQNGISSRVLLDFYNFGNIPKVSSPALLLPRTEALSKLGIEKLLLQETSFYIDLQKHLQSWQSKSPLLVKFLEQAIKNISIYYTTYKISNLDANTYFPIGFFHETLEPRSVAYYAKDFGVLVSLNEFEQLSYENQKGLLFHEVVRHLQISYGFVMNDKTVQFLVNAILTADAANSPSLDTVEYFGFQKWKDLNEVNDPAKVEIFFKEAARIIKKYTGKNVNADLRSVKNTLAEMIVTDNYRCEARQEEKNCMTKNDQDKAALLIAEIRVVQLSGIVHEFNAIEDDVKDRTLLLANARQLDLQIECANNKVCTSESSKNRLSGPFVELIKSGSVGE